MGIPAEYRGREQTYLKHRFLAAYLETWSHKIASLSRGGKVVKLWYVDCFAGPWRSQSQNFEDTSIHIGLHELRRAVNTWRKQGQHVTAGAVFVEKNKRAYDTLEAYLGEQGGDVECHPLYGEFGTRIPDILRIVRNEDPALVFVDPTGFKGVAMDYIARLSEPRMRDVIINVMFNDINRWKDDSRPFLRQQMRDFFGLSNRDLPSGLGEDELFEEYRNNLKRRSTLTYAADLVVPHPTHKRAWFRLVVAGKDPKVLEVFRDIEHRVLGSEAAAVRTGASRRLEEDRTGQAPLFSADQEAADTDAFYRLRFESAHGGALAMVIELLRHRSWHWRELWPVVLEVHHLRLVDLCRLLADAHRRGDLVIDPPPPRTRIQDTALLRLRS